MDDRYYDFVLPSGALAKDFVERAAAEFPQDVSFYRRGTFVRVFNGTSAPLYGALEKISDALRITSPKLTRRVSDTGVIAVRPRT